MRISFGHKSGHTQLFVSSPDARSQDVHSRGDNDDLVEEWIG
jgi:hypothetical protein